MRLWTWGMLQKEFNLQPKAWETFANLMRDQYESYEQYLELDDQKCDVVATVIGCKCAADLKQHRREVHPKPDRWEIPNRWETQPSVKNLQINRRYREHKKCHRVFFGKRAGIRCYCDEHKH